MKFSVDFRGRMWTGLLLLAASCMVQAADNTTAPLTALNVTSPASTTLSSHISKENASTPLAPTNSSTTTKPVTTPAPATSPTTSTTKGTAATNATTTTTTVTSKATSKTSPVVVTSSSPVTSTISATLQKKSGFDVGSFIGGIVLTLCLLAAAYFGCRFYNSRRGVRYRTIDEHEAII
ncbi:porimin [Leptodactylus fuscus]|uniref:porimin n=1 Tax=Leptodactylus fuscus TaxID=238119 RepID=UPI003F4EA146